MTYENNGQQEKYHEKTDRIIDRITETEKAIRIGEIIRISIPNLNFRLNFGGLGPNSWHY